MEEGKFEGAKAHFVKLLDEPQSLVGKVYVQYILSKIYAYEGQVEQERQALEFVAQNGGETYFAVDARIRLKSK